MIDVPSLLRNQAPGLGNVLHEDPRKADHPLAARLGEPPALRNVSFAMFSHPLDQGRTGTCVGHGGKHWEITSPVIRTRALGPPTATDVYLEATKRDPWHGGQADTTLQDGTSITALMLALRDAFGLITEFTWTDSVDDLLAFMCGPQGGPVVLGLPWFNSMFTTDAEGFVRVDAASGLAGGHCITGALLNVKRGFMGGPNSWGRPLDFGRIDPKTGLSDGRWRMDLEDLRFLLRNGGDACVARELPRAA